MPPRFILAGSLALLAAAPLAAQKPGAGEEPDRARWREQGIPICVAELRTAEGLDPEALEAICGCAFERAPAGRKGGATPTLDGGRLRAELGGQLLSCAVRERPDRASAVARWLTGRSSVPPPVTVPPPAPPEESDKPSSGPAPAPSPGFDPSAWWDGLALPSWLSGWPRWAWIPIGLLALLLLASLFRRREAGRDLTGPPAHMRPGGRVGRHPGPPRGR
jgi:hypothetical protein